MTARLLAGPELAAGAESLVDHWRRLGPLPGPDSRRSIIPALADAGLLGRGGAAFPVARKWASVAERGRGRAVILANGAEGEPLAAKDRLLMAARPHLVLDGAVLAADVVGADRVVLYVGEAHQRARMALERALVERRDLLAARSEPRIDLVIAPSGYVAGEESAAVHYVNEGDARPTSVPPRPYERGVDGRPTLVQNVETLAHAALIARLGPDWYRRAGRAETKGTALVTIAGAPHNGVIEVDLGSTIADVAGHAGVGWSSGAPVLVGGYFGGWVAGEDAWRRPLDPTLMRRGGGTFGAGVVAFLQPGECGVRASARILDFLAGQSAAQCGPCVFGLRAIADAAARIAERSPRADDLRRLSGWSHVVAGRGACRHPDGAAGLLQSALRTFDGDFAAHTHHRECRAARRSGRAA